MKQEFESPSRLELRLLGAARVTVDGVPVEERVWTRRKSKALLKILALSQNHQMHREQLMELLWPEMEPEQAANNLHKVIHAARRALEPQLKSGADSRFILTHDQHVLLGSPGELWIDVAEFERRANQAIKSDNPADCESALELYEGELLSEDRYEDWAASRREQLSALAQRLISSLGRFYESSGEIGKSIENYRRLLEFDQANEDAHRRLMRLYASAGSRHQAIQQYQQCRETLKKELDAEPEASTVRLYEEIVSGRISPPYDQDSAEASQTTISDPKASADRKKSKIAVYAPIAALTLAAAIAGIFFYLHEKSEPQVESIVVLPFVNGGADSNFEYLSDGITESIINTLSKFPNLRVTARTTAFRYKGREVDPQAIGRDLKVRVILTGKILQRGDSMIIQADLIDSSDGRQIWGDQFNSKISDILSVQSRIAGEISETLKLKLSNEDQQRASKQPTSDIEAYQAYLKGRYYWNRRTVPELQRAIEHFNQAISIDPGYAAAYAGLADCYHTLSNLQLPPNEAIPRARQAAMRALELDDQLAGAHASLAVGKWRYDWDWQGAEAGFKRAIELDPNYAPAHQWRGQLLTYQKKFDEGSVELKRAQQLDPLSLVITANMGLPLFFSRQNDEAIAQFQRAIELDRNFPFVHFYLGWAFEQKRDYAAALDAFQKAVDLDPTPSALSYLGHGHAVSGNRQKAEEIIERLKKLAGQRYVSPYYFAVIYSGMGEKELALEWLNKGVEDHSDPMVLLGVEPKFDGLRSSPQFLEILRRVGLGQ